MFIVSREKVHYHRDESGPNQKEADTSNLGRKTTEMNEAEDYEADWHKHQRCYQQPMSLSLALILIWVELRGRASPECSR